MTTQASPRERLLDAAGELFYLGGVNVGVEALCKAAGVSKKSMYQLFRSKDEVIAESLARRGPSYQALLLPADGKYLGCPLVSTAIELKNAEHPGSVVARRLKQELTDFFESEAAAAGARDPELLAQQLTIVFDGASARAVVRAKSLDGVGVTTAAALLEAAGVAA
jgi:AcrR family transcriptional regulator